MVLKDSWRDDCDEFFEQYYKKYNSIYAGIKANARELILDYYKYRTIEIFNSEYPNYKFKVTDDAKLDKLCAVAEGADDWVFGGIVDLGSVIGHCSLGHALRYEYTAISRKLNKIVVFGSKCASDFFDVPRTVMTRLTGIQNQVSREVKEILYILYNGLTSSYKNKYYANFPVPYMSDDRRADKLESQLDSEFIQMVIKFLKCGMPLTQYMYRRINEAMYFVNTIIEKEDTQAKERKEAEERYNSLLSSYSEERLGSVKDILSTSKNTMCFTQTKIAGIIASEIGAKLEDNEFRILVGTFNFLNRDRDKISGRIGDVVNNSELTKYTRIKARRSPAEYGAEYDGNGFPVPVYADESQSIYSYEYKYRKKIWEGLNALNYMYTGNYLALKGFYAASRSKDYNYTDTPEENKQITMCAIGRVKKVFEMLSDDEYIDKFKDEEIGQQMFVEKALQMNKTTRDGEEVLKEPFESIYNKMMHNMNLIYDKNVVSMLKSFKYEKLSDKQKNYICSVYSRIKDKINVSGENALKCRLQGTDMTLVTKVMILCDANKRRVALLMLQESNRCVSGYKILPTDTGSIHNNLLNIDGSKVVPMVITNANSVGSSVSAIISKFERIYAKDLNIVEAKDCGIDINDEKYNVQEVRKEDEELARKYFKNEGVIDRFMVRVAKCLEENVKVYGVFNKDRKENN